MTKSHFLSELITFFKKNMNATKTFYLIIVFFLFATLSTTSCKKDDKTPTPTPVKYVGTWVCNTNTLDSISFTIKNVNQKPWVTAYYVYLKHIDGNSSYEDDYSLELSEGIVEVISGEFSLEINNQNNKTVNCTFEDNNFATGSFNFIWGANNFLHSQGSFTAQKH